MKKEIIFAIILFLVVIMNAQMAGAVGCEVTITEMGSSPSWIYKVNVLNTTIGTDIYVCIIQTVEYGGPGDCVYACSSVIGDDPCLEILDGDDVDVDITCLNGGGAGYYRYRVEVCVCTNEGCNVEPVCSDDSGCIAIP